MSTYLVRLDTVAAVGRYESIKAAEMAAAHKKWEFTIFDCAKDMASMLTTPQLIALHNNLVPADQHLKEFHTKGKAVARVWELLEACEKFRVVREAKPTSSAAEPHQPKDLTKGTGLVWAIADKVLKKNPDATRSDVMEACAAAGVNPATAATQWQRYRTAHGL